MMNTEKDLLKLILNGRNAHFYLLTPTKNTPNASSYLFKWCAKLIKELIKTTDNRLLDISNHPDVLLIDQTNVKNKFYDIKIIEEIEKFFQTSVLQLPKKIMIIHDAVYLSEIQQNKLLKLLEAPPVESIIVLLNPKLVPILETVASRAQEIKFFITEEVDRDANFTKWNEKLASKDLTQFIEYFRKKQEQEQDLATTLMDITTKRMSKAPKQSLTDTFNLLDQYLKTSTVDLDYNHSSYERLTLLYRALQQLKGT